MTSSFARKWVRTLKEAYATGVHSPILFRPKAIPPSCGRDPHFLAHVDACFSPSELASLFGLYSPGSAPASKRPSLILFYLWDGRVLKRSNCPLFSPRPDYYYLKIFRSHTEVIAITLLGSQLHGLLRHSPLWKTDNV